MAILSGFIKTIKYRLTDTGYKWQSEKTSSQTVVMGDGTDNTDTAEKRFGAIKGLTSSTSVSDTGYALDATVGKKHEDAIATLNQSLSSFENRIAYTGGLTPSTTDKTTIVKFPEGFTPRNCVPLCCWVAINDNFCGSLEGYKWGTMTFSKDEIRVQVNDSGVTNKIFTVVLLRLT